MAFLRLDPEELSLTDCKQVLIALLGSKTHCGSKMEVKIEEID